MCKPDGSLVMMNTQRNVFSQMFRHQLTVFPFPAHNWMFFWLTLLIVSCRKPFLNPLKSKSYQLGGEHCGKFHCEFAKYLDILAFETKTKLKNFCTQYSPKVYVPSSSETKKYFPKSHKGPSQLEPMIFAVQCRYTAISFYPSRLSNTWRSLAVNSPITQQ